MKLATLTLVFENLQQYTLSHEFIDVFTLSDLKKNFGLVNYSANDLSETEYAESLILRITPEANTQWKDNELFKRITDYNDLTLVCINSTNQPQRDIYVNWSDTDNDPNNNARQTTGFDSKGGLWIAVSPNADETAEEFILNYNA